MPSQNPSLFIQSGCELEHLSMFGFKKKDPTAKLREKYEACMKAAIESQRIGDIRGFAAKSEEAAALERKLEAAERLGSSPPG